MKLNHYFFAVILALISLYSCSKGGEETNEVKQNSYTLTFFTGGDNLDKLCIEITKATGPKTLDLKAEGKFEFYYRYLDPKWDAYYGEQSTFRNILLRELATPGEDLVIVDFPSIDLTKEVITGTSINLTLGFYLTKQQAFGDTITLGLSGSIGDPVPCEITYRVKKDDPILKEEFFTINGKKLQ